jgi:hypothetical protein
MLIRELEFYDRSMLHLEQPVKLRVRFLFRVTRFYADLHRMTWLKRLISCLASPYLPTTILHCVSQLATLFLLVGLVRILIENSTDMTPGTSWVEDPVVQNLLIDLLRRSEREDGWPWGYMHNQVVQAWRPI